MLNINLRLFLEISKGLNVDNLFSFLYNDY